MNAEQRICITDIQWRMKANKRERVATLKFELLADMPIKSSEMLEIIEEFRKVMKKSRGEKV